MSIGPVLEQARTAFLRRMRASCTIARVTGTTTDPLTGAVTPTTTPVWTGKCYARYPGLAHESTPEAGGHTYVEARIVVRIPLGVAVNPGDIVTITADPDNPGLNGTVLTVASIDVQSQATAQRLLCVDRQA